MLVRIRRIFLSKHANAKSFSSGTGLSLLVSFSLAPREGAEL